MRKRKSPSPIVTKQLWAESIGHCMNPRCQSNLISQNTNIGDRAHITPHAEGGKESFENLILLCRNCHKMIDDNRTDETESQLRQWKDSRNNEIQKRFTKKYMSFEELKKDVVPILKRNGQIFRSYGPESENIANTELYRLWLRFEKELIVNNKQMELIFTNNKNLFHTENEKIINAFIMHTHEFIKTRGGFPLPRVNLFPKGLLSIFGLERDIHDEPPPNISALQNFISSLIQEGRFIDLQLTPDQILTYRENGKVTDLNLKDRPKVQQIFWSGNFYHPATTDLRLGNLVFFLNWLYCQNVSYEFKDPRALTELIINGKYKVKLYYKYCLSISDLYEINVESELIVVNLHNWNDESCISQDAHEHARQVGFKLFSQNKFFQFVHRKIKK